ncbi:MAG: hypothetical protein Q7V62_00120 [Actinomycetota bacterium]|nr:hypothetical protein [Actinomycetota bacterium]
MGGDFSVASNACLAAAVVVLVYKRLDARYHFQVLMLLVAAVASSYYHLCWTHALAWCIGDWGASAPHVAMSRDVMAAFQAMCVASIFVDQWWMRHRFSQSPRVFAWFCIITSLATWLLVAHFGDDLPAIISIPVFWALVTAYALMYDRTRVVGRVAWSYTRWALLLAALGALAGGVGCRIGVAQEFSSTTPPHDQPDRMLMLHGMTHVLFGVGALLAVCTLDSHQPEHAYAPVGKGVALLAGKVSSSKPQR